MSFGPAKVPPVSGAISREPRGVGFVRGDNDSSLRAHRKMAMREIGGFTNDAVPYVAFTYSGDAD